MKDSTCFIVVAVACFVSFFSTLKVAVQRDEYKEQLTDYKKQAVEFGYAEFVVVEENKTEFKWKNSQPLK